MKPAVVDRDVIFVVVVGAVDGGSARSVSYVFVVVNNHERVTIKLGSELCWAASAEP